MKLILLIVLSSFALAQSPIPPGAHLEKLATGFQQPEGPVWKDGVGLLFSDIARSTIYEWSPADTLTKVYLHPSDSSNGLTLDRQGRLILTQMLTRRVSRQEFDGTITALASTYNGKRFNSPNDVIVKSDGSIFFTDPDFNVPGGSKNKELTFKGIYRIGLSGSLTLLDSSLALPNGICFSPDEKYLYVNDSQNRIIYVWDVVNDSTISGKRTIYTISTLGYADGMKTDAAGNIYCSGPTGIWVVSPSGVLLDRIAMAENPSNCSWGDADRRSLYITAGSSLYRIRLTSTGVLSPQIRKSGYYELENSYPNPCNPGTQIRFHTPSTAFVTLNVYDMLGRKIAMLVSESLQSGDHSVHWDTGGVASGIYIYRLSSGPFVNAKKIVVMK